MVPKFINALFSSFLSVLLWIASLYHGGLIVLAILCSAKLPPAYDVPLGWTQYLDSNGASSFSFWVYFSSLTAYLIWETVHSDFKKPKGIELLFQKAGAGENAVVGWFLLDLFARYNHHHLFYSLMPDYLDKTLAVCFLLWLDQKIVNSILRNRQAIVVANPVRIPKAPVETIPLPSKDVMEEKNQLKLIVPVKQELPNDQSLAELEEKILKYIRRHEKAGTAELVKALRVPPRTVNYWQKKLLSNGRLERVGKGKAAVYRLK